METLIQRKRRALKTLVSLMDDQRRPYSDRAEIMQKCMGHLNHLDRRIRSEAQG